MRPFLRGIVTGFGVLVNTFPIIFLLNQAISGPHYDRLASPPVIIGLFIWGTFHAIDQLEFRAKHQIWPWMPISLVRFSRLQNQSQPLARPASSQESSK